MSFFKKPDQVLDLSSDDCQRLVGNWRGITPGFFGSVDVLLEFFPDSRFKQINKHRIGEVVLTAVDSGEWQLLADKSGAAEKLAKRFTDAEYFCEGSENEQAASKLLSVFQAGKAESLASLNKMKPREFSWLSAAKFTVIDPEDGKVTFTRVVG